MRQANSLVTFSSQIVWLIKVKKLNISAISTCVSDLRKGLNVQKLICLFQLENIPHILGIKQLPWLGSFLLQEEYDRPVLL